MANTVKVPSKVGLPALCGHIKSIRQTANAAANGVVQLSNALNQSVSEIEAALNDLPSAASITILPAEWVKDASINTGYQYYYDIVNSEVDSADLPLISIAPGSLETTAACELCPTCESMNGKIRLYSKNVPVSSIVIDCWIIRGIAESNEEGGS